MASLSPEMTEHALQAGGMERLARLLHHEDRTQLVFQLVEIVRERTYLRHGVEVRDGDVVLDVGANVGVAAAFFASECGAGQVHSFEPVAPIFRMLSGNLRHFPACVGHNYGLSSSSGRAPITYYPNANAMSGLYADANEDRAHVRTYMINSGMSEGDADRELDGRYDAVTLECELRTLSSVLREESLERVDLLKIDVEKAELDVLYGIEAADWSSIKQIVAEVHDEHGRGATMARMLKSYGFSVTTEQDPMWRGTAARMLYAIRQ
jgi:31-O-methyltransferase